MDKQTNWLLGEEQQGASDSATMKMEFKTRLFGDDALMINGELRPWGPSPVGFSHADPQTLEMVFVRCVSLRIVARLYSSIIGDLWILL